MKFNKNLSAIHSYLCADGYVIKNPATQKHKYYHIGLRNTNLTLLEDFQKRFYEEFGIKPIITNDGRCRVQNKEIYLFLTKNHSFYSSNWKLPKISKENLRYWLRSYFDCEGWVVVIRAKNRQIGLESINEKGIYQIKTALKEFFDINSNILKRKNRNTWTLTICGKDNLKKFQKEINFLHSKKASKLVESINSYQNYNWRIPQTKKELIKFIQDRGRINGKRNEIRFFSILNINLKKFAAKLKKFRLKYKMFGPWENNLKRKYYCLTIKYTDFKKLKGGNK